MSSTKFLIVGAAVALVVGGGTASAAHMIRTSGIAKGAVTMNRLAPDVQKQIKLHAKPGADGVAGVNGKDGAAGANGVAGPAGAKGAQGAKGTDGAPGLKGDTGAKGDIGANGADGAPGLQGAKGDTGTDGSDGAPGSKGDKGDTGSAAPVLDYGIANVIVSRHKLVNAVNTVVTSIWAQYATSLGSPVGNNSAGGSFRFTCSTVQAPCAIAVSTAVLGTADHTIYPRLIVTRDGDGDGGGSPTLVQCEYADGSIGANPMTITHQASSASPTYTAVPTNIGGSADCGNVPAGPAGDVATIVVPNGYYDVSSTYTFS